MATIEAARELFAGDVRESKTASTVLSVLMILSGVLAIGIPPLAGLAVTIAFGWLLIATGGLHLGLAFRKRDFVVSMGEVLIAMLCTAIGVYVLAKPVVGLASLTLAIAAYLAGKGVLEGAIGFALRRFPGSGWFFVDSVLTLAIAFAIASAWPASTAWAIGLLVGVALISSGFARLMVSIAVRPLVR